MLGLKTGEKHSIQETWVSLNPRKMSRKYTVKQNLQISKPQEKPRAFLPLPESIHYIGNPGREKSA